MPLNHVLYDQLKFKGNRMDYYNALNLYMHQVNMGVRGNTVIIYVEVELTSDELYSV